jgi:uracil-DNA glycosylase
VHAARLAGETDVAGFRRAAREFVAGDVAPDRIHWSVEGGASDLFDADLPTPEAQAGAALAVPRSFAELCDRVVLHADPQRFDLLYRLLWRAQRQPELLRDPLDADRLRAEEMARAVRRDMHKMTAFVRFRPIAGDDGDEWHVAWFEPFHHIVDATAPFFMRRFAQMRWAIVTPDRSVRWDGTELQSGPGGRREDAPPADAGEALWLTYYRHIFNPARLKVKAMEREMPHKYWHNLPEAGLIAPLVQEAMTRTGRMVEAAPTVPRRRIVVPMRPRVDEDAVLPDDPVKALAMLARASDRCRECPIGEMATQSVFGEGPVGAALMVVGEQPGDQEDLRGRPFVGPSGKLFDRAVAQLGWQREKLYVSNAVKHFKYELRGQRRIHKTPSQREAEACLHWLEREIELVNPRALVALGGTAARSLLQRPVAVLSERGRWHTDRQGRPVLVTLHPSALLRGDPAEREEAWVAWLADLELASHHLAGP